MVLGGGLPATSSTPLLNAGSARSPALGSGRGRAAPGALPSVVQPKFLQQSDPTLCLVQAATEQRLKPCLQFVFFLLMICLFFFFPLCRRPWAPSSEAGAVGCSRGVPQPPLATSCLVPGGLRAVGSHPAPHPVLSISSLSLTPSPQRFLSTLQSCAGLCCSSTPDFSGPGAAFLGAGGSCPIWQG